MPAKHLLRAVSEGTYSHIYNRGIENRAIFNDERDYFVFLGYLREYLSTPSDPETSKKAFTVNGRTYRGMPHQPRNYFNNVDLIAYSLSPDHFHLILYQRTKDSLASFLRSLCTRYSMYYNKKYSRSGSLFDGPYKSIQINNIDKLPYLSRYIFRHDEDKKDSINAFSSYDEFTGVKTTEWIKPDVVIKKTGDFAKFTEKFDPKEDNKLLEGLIFEEQHEFNLRPQMLEGIQAGPVKGETFKAKPRVAEFTVSATAVFLVLFTLGARNINITNAENKIADTPPASVSEAVLSATPRTRLVVSVPDGTSSVNIRKEPTATAEVISKANNGDIFEFVSETSGWYQILLEDGAAYISASYIQIIEEDN